jgi:hypothetical protein
VVDYFGLPDDSEASFTMKLWASQVVSLGIEKEKETALVERYGDARD